MKVLYFAWLRERLNKSEETIHPPAEVVTVSDLLDWIAAQDEAAALAFADRALIHVAIDEEIVDHTTPIMNAQTIALFPPMTGG